MGAILSLDPPGVVVNYSYAGGPPDASFTVDFDKPVNAFGLRWFDVWDEEYVLAKLTYIDGRKF
jgi:hypothetical protein